MSSDRFTRTAPARAIALAASVLLFGLVDGALALAEPLTVGTKSGRTFTGEVEGHSARGLWLRSGSDVLHVVRPIAWDRVAYVAVGGERMTPEVALARLRRGEFVTPEAPLPADAEELPTGRRLPRDVSQEALRPAPRDALPQSLSIEAEAANWDSDVESDGLLVHILPIDADGYITPTHGMLEVELVGQQRATRSIGQPTVQLARWAQMLEPRQFGPDGAVIKLPFGSIHPEFDTRLRPVALVHARLAVAGNAVLEASTSAVRVRPYSAFRDRLEQLQGTRFLPSERTGEPVTIRRDGR